MAGIKISALPVIPSSALTDVAPYVKAGTTYQASTNQLITLLNTNLQLSSTAQVTGLSSSLASFLPLAGDIMTGQIDMDMHKITIYLSCIVSFASGTVTACGGIYARRVR